MIDRSALNVFSCCSRMCSAIGAGAVKSNMAVFGAEQIQSSKISSRYFDKYMVAVNIGSIVSTIALPYVQTNPIHYFTGYVAAAALLVVAAVLFVAGWRYYIHVEPYETVITKCIPVLINACQTWYKYGESREVDEANLDSASARSLSRRVPSLTQGEPMRMDERPRTFLDFAKAANKGKFSDRIVDDVKSLRSAMLVFALLIPYWLIYDQVRSLCLRLD